MHNPLVSIVVPCYNAEGTLKKTLFSVAMQEYSNFEVIIVNDGSSDETPEIVRRFEQWDKRFRGRTQENRGVSAARNKGVEIAKGDYIAFLDADDLFLERSITERMSILIKEDEPDMLGVFCPAVMIDIHGNVLKSTRHFDYNLPGDRLYFSSTPESVFNPSCVIVKKCELLKSGGFDETITPAEDYDLWHRMMRGGGYFRKVGSCSIGWRQHSMSAAHSKILKHFNQCKIVTRRIFSQSQDGAAKEFRDGYGTSLYFLIITKRAFSSAIMAVVSGQYEDAREISSDINNNMLEQIGAEALEEIIRHSALRALSKHEDEWLLTVWPQAQDAVLKFIQSLNERFGGTCNSLSVLVYKLKHEGPADLGIGLDTSMNVMKGQPECRK
jgi:glycosyltransferase involved in cell wall biosynthesis